jgi:molecular chaperone DnaK
MRTEAEKHAEEDKAKKELVEAKNMADSLIYTTEKTLKDAGDKVPEADKKDIEGKMEELKKVKEGDDKEAIKKAYDSLGEAIQKVGAAMYGQAQPNPETEVPKEEGTDGEGPVEGEVVDEDKKE